MYQGSPVNSVAARLLHKSPGDEPGLFHFPDICRAFISEPPRTRTWNLEIKSLSRQVSGCCSGLQNSLSYEVFTFSL